MKFMKETTRTRTKRSRATSPAVETRSTAAGTDLHCRRCGVRSTFRGMEARSALDLHALVCPHGREHRPAPVAQTSDAVRPHLTHLYA